MPRGDKSSYTDKQKREAEHIEKGYEHRGVAKPEAQRRAWATVNKMTGGGKLSGSGRVKPKITNRRKKADDQAARPRQPVRQQRDRPLPTRRRARAPLIPNTEPAAENIHAAESGGLPKFVRPWRDQAAALSVISILTSSSWGGTTR